MHLSQTSAWKVMTIWISRELPLFIFERLYKWCTLVRHPFEKLWPFEFLEGFRCSFSSASIYYKPESDLSVKSYDHFNFPRASVVHFRASLYLKRLNLTSVWKVMTIRIFRELPLFNLEHLEKLFSQIGHQCEKLWPFEFLERFRCSISSV